MEKKYTPGNWTVGKLSGTVITDKIPEDYKQGSGHDATDCYGGFLIAESINNRDVKLIAASPELLEALIELKKWVNNLDELTVAPMEIVDAAIKKATE